MSTVNLAKHTVNLSKGQKINLSKSSDTGLKEIMVGLGWSAASAVQSSQVHEVTEVVQPGFFGKLFGAKPKTVTRRVESTGSRRKEEIDCDAWVVLLQNGELKADKDIIYYGNKDLYAHNENVVHHHGDNLIGNKSGNGKGDDEEITINLKELPSNYDSIIVGVTIYSGKEKGQSFGNISDTFVRVVDKKDNFEICRFNQTEMAENKDAITFIAGKLYKDHGEWQFEAIGKGTMSERIRDEAMKYKRN